MSQPAPDFPHFAYRSNMSSPRLTAPKRAPSATRVAVGYVPGRRLTFDKFSTRDQSGKCDCEETGNRRAGSTGWSTGSRLPNGRLSTRLRDCTAAYRDQILTVIVGGATHDALAYVATDTRRGLSVFDWYLEPVLAGAAENELPLDYVKAIQQVPTVVDEKHER